MSPRSVLGNFAYQKMAMVKDLQDNLDQIAAHDLVAAIAGDPGARKALRSLGAGESPRNLDLIPPNNEFLVLDADSTQQVAIAGALSLRNGVIYGPPGTGKSQTIANLIAELAARGRRVLFVAEKRAALEVVLDRLQHCGLRHLALDLHGAGTTRRSVMSQFSESLKLIHDSTPADLDEFHRRFVDRRKRLNEHDARMHQSRAPSGLSVYKLQGRLMRFSTEQQTSIRWRAGELDRLSPDVMDEAQGLLSELEGFSGLFLRTDRSEWTGAKLNSGLAVQETIDALRNLIEECWPMLQAEVSKIIAASKAPNPKTLDELRFLLGLLNGVNKSLESFQPAIFQQNLPAVIATLSPARSRPSAVLAWCFSGNYRRVRKKIRKLRRDGEKSGARLLEAVIMAEAQFRRWNSLAPGEPPVISDGLATCRSILDQTIANLDKVTSVLAHRDLRRSSIHELLRLTQALAADTNTPHRLPRLIQIEERLSALGLGKLQEEIRRRQPDSRIWGKILEHAWLASCLDSARSEDPNLAGFNGSAHQRFRDEF